MKLPAIIVNFKTYESATGERALKLAKIHEKIAKKTGKTIAVCVQPSDIYRISKAVKIPVFSQHIDNVDFGAHTGQILAQTVKQAGAFGTLINHSEKQVPTEKLKEIIIKAKEAGLFTIVCANTPEKAKEIAKFNPDLIAVEPPELIGGDISVSKAKPEVIKKAVLAVGKGRLLVGAGVKNGDDVRIALKLGAMGILVASGVVQAKNPEEALLDLAKGLM
jgi:triosephosphate isomerase (TIM)